MSKKIDDEEIEDDNLEEKIPEYSEEEEDVQLDVGSPLDDDLDGEINIIIEISDDPIIDSKEPDADVESDDVVLSKHKLQGKHSLKYDSIFKGKKDEKLDEESGDASSMYFNEKFELDKSSFFYTESYDNESYIRSKDVKEKVYNILLKNTSINFMSNRRKPSRVDFNEYYQLLKITLSEEGYTNIELFNELSVYFSDNLFNMFKLLDNKWRNMIIDELHDHIGKHVSSKEITNRNIYIGTELEFIHNDVLEESKIFTGVVVETDYDNSIFKVDSYENIYDVHISFITTILKNTKFKYNLNKLDNIDFL